MLAPEWRFVASLYLPRQHCVVYRDDRLAVQLQVMKRRNWILLPPKEKEYYFIDGVKKVFRNESRLVAALEKRGSPLRKKTHQVPGAIPAWRRLAYSLNLF